MGCIQAQRIERKMQIRGMRSTQFKKCSTAAWHTICNFRREMRDLEDDHMTCRSVECLSIRSESFCCSSKGSIGANEISIV
jgi:hypothetical protein